MVVVLLLALGSLPLAACTGVVLARDGHVIAGEYQDSCRSHSYLWAEPVAGRRPRFGRSGFRTSRTVMGITDDHRRIGYGESSSFHPFKVGHCTVGREACHQGGTG